MHETNDKKLLDNDKNNSHEIFCNTDLDESGFRFGKGISPEALLLPGCVPASVPALFGPAAVESKRR